jgi:hypothetical protein
MTKRIVSLIAVVLFILFGIWAIGKFQNFKQKKTSDQAVLLLESVKKVTKLIAVEGFFSEIYDYKDYYGIDFSFFRKKALLRVKAKVSVGYDFEKLKFIVDEKSKSITIGPVGKAEILSVDHNIDYYDISEGTFNSFSTEDFNRLNKNAKEFIIKQVEKSPLINEAENQKEKIINTISTMAKTYGWQIIISKDGLLK